jgi:hypothetical protein
VFFVRAAKKAASGVGVGFSPLYAGDEAAVCDVAEVEIVVLG